MKRATRLAEEGTLVIEEGRVTRGQRELIAGYAVALWVSSGAGPELPTAWEAAHRLGVHPSTVYNWRNGHPIPLPQARKMFQAIDEAIDLLCPPASPAAGSPISQES